MIYESLSAFTSRVYCFTSFVNTAQGFPQPLSREEEKKCFEAFKAGDKSARDKLINHNLRLVAHIVKKFQNSLEADDLISVGTIGLIKAVDTFDYGKGSQLSTYASRCIENEILMLIRSNKRHKDVISLSSTYKGKSEGDELTLEDILVGDDDETFIHEVETACVYDQVKEVMKSCLTDAELEIIKLRYGLDGHDAMTQKEVAEIFGYSRSYISRIETRALKTVGKVLKSQEREN